MINLNAGSKYSYQAPQSYSGNTVGIMSGSMPSGNSQQQQPLASTKRQLDLPAYMEVQQQARNQNRQVTFDEFVGVGNDPADYSKLQNYYASIGSSAPPAPLTDPYRDVYQNQRQQNYIQAGQDASMNRINEYNPYGQSQYITNADGSVSRVSSLSEPNQQLLNQQYYQDTSRNNAIGGMLDQWAQGYTPMSQDYQGEANRVENQMFDKSMGDINKYYDRDLENKRTQLLNSGVGEGTERYSRAMEEYQKSKADAVLNARNNAVTAGQTQGNYLMNQELTRRQQPLSEMSALQSQIRGPQTPTFSQNYNVQMPYMDTATSSVAAMNQNALWGREDSLRDLEWSREDKLRQEDFERSKALQRGSGGSSRPAANANAAYEQQLLNFAMQSALNPKAQAPNPLLQGLIAGGSQGLGTALGSYLGS